MQMELHNLLLVLTEHRCKMCTIHAAGYSELQFPTNLLDFVDRFNCWECFWNLSLSLLKPGWAYHCISTHQRNYYVATTFLPAHLNWTCLTFRPKSKSNVLDITFQDYQGIRNYLNQHFWSDSVDTFFFRWHFLFFMSPRAEVLEWVSKTSIRGFYIIVVICTFVDKIPWALSDFYIPSCLVWWTHLRIPNHNSKNDAFNYWYYKNFP